MAVDRVLAADVARVELEADDDGTASRALDSVGGVEVGVWEIGPGTVRDTEVDEVFVVLSGAGTVRFLDDGTTLELGPGVAVRLRAGERTEWEIRETLRKVYVA